MARAELVQILRAKMGTEKALGVPEGCRDRELLDSLLKCDSPVEVTFRSLGLSNKASSLAIRLLQKADITPRVRDMARDIEDKLTPRMPRPPKALWVQRTASAKFKEMVDALEAKTLVGQADRAALVDDTQSACDIVTRIDSFEVRPAWCKGGAEEIRTKECTHLHEDEEVSDVVKRCLQKPISVACFDEVEDCTLRPVVKPGHWFFLEFEPNADSPSLHTGQIDEEVDHVTDDLKLGDWTTSEVSCNLVDAVNRVDCDPWIVTIPLKERLGSWSWIASCLVRY